MNAAKQVVQPRNKVIAILVAGIGSLVAGMIYAEPPAKPAPNLTIPLFHRWPKENPDVAIVMTGEQHGYLKFCGCSNPKVGGLERRANFINELKAKGWPIVALDLGDIIERPMNAVQQQTLLKYKTTMKALNALGYAAVGVGEKEFNLPLLDGLAEFTLQNPGANPRLMAANLMDRDQNFPSGDGKGSMIGDVVIIEDKKNAKVPKIGTVALVAPSVRKEIKDKTLNFEDNKAIIGKALDAFSKADVRVRVLLYQGDEGEARLLAGAKEFENAFHLILCKSAQDEPPADPVMVGNTMIVMVGWKTKHVGVAGIFCDAENPRKFTIHWEKVKLGDEYETKSDAEAAKHPMVMLLEEYSKAVKDQNLMERYTKTPHPIKVKNPSWKVEYSGSAACQRCHAESFKVWQGMRHSHAYQTLATKATKPSLRQYDGECIGCHVIGFQFNGGFVSEQKTPNLKDVGCESCHGPASLHASQPNDKKYYADLSPWKIQRDDYVTKTDGTYDNAVLLRVDAMCQKCHDIDNDPLFKFEQFWPKIKHGPRANIKIKETAADTPAGKDATVTPTNGIPKIKE